MWTSEQSTLSQVYSIALTWFPNIWTAVVDTILLFRTQPKHGSHNMLYQESKRTHLCLRLCTRGRIRSSRGALLLLCNSFWDLLNNLLDPSSFLVPCLLTERPLQIGRGDVSHSPMEVGLGYPPGTERDDHKRSNCPVRSNEWAYGKSSSDETPLDSQDEPNTCGHPSNDTNPRPARNAAQETIPRTRYLTDPLQIIPQGYSLPYPGGVYSGFVNQYKMGCAHR